MVDSCDDRANPGTATMETTVSEPAVGPAKKSCIFSKLIVPSILVDKKLRIPNKLLKKYGDELSSVVMLTVPSGRVWVVELRKVNQKLWLDTGWEQFVEFYSICVGHLLVFKYEGNSCFTVQIFDLSASEIKYPCKELNYAQEPLTSLSFITSAACAKTSCLGQETCGPLTRDIGIQFSGVEVQSEVESQFLHEEGHVAKKIKQECDPELCVELASRYEVKEQFLSMVNSSDTYKGRRPVTIEEKKSAIRAAEMFNPKNPFCRVILRPSYIYKGLVLHVPASFARACLNDAVFITLQVPEGKRWRVRCLTTSCGMKFSKGWPEFVWDNNLTEGDVCVFECISTNDIVLKVTIFRALECAKSVKPAATVTHSGYLTH